MFDFSRLPRALSVALLVLQILLFTRPSAAYSLLTHEQLIDLTWESSIAPFLRSRYPNLSPEQLEQARSYAYGGCAIQDVGYYPFGDGFYSQLTHYVRSGDFVVNLFRSAHNANEFAFAIGALSHYIGDTVGHSEAVNLAVPVEFPRLRAKYGPVVSYEQDERAHVQTEFAFDIDEITHLRLAPVHYLRHIGLNVPIDQVTNAFYLTYGIGENFARTRRRRISISGYRFAVRSFIPSVAYAVALLHRNRMPPDADTPGMAKLKNESARAAMDANWDLYRKKAGIGTYSLAAILYLLPKIGALKLVAIKGPTPGTEAEYVRSVNASVDALRSTLLRFGVSHQTLPNRDLDTGQPVRPGGYRLTDDTYAKLLHRVVADPKLPVPPGLKADISHYYSNPDAPIVTKKDPAAWARVQADLKTLATMPVSDQPIAAETE